MSGVGRRYAGALEGALGKSAPESVLADLEAFGGWLKAVPALKTALENPGIPAASKKKIVETLGREAGFQPPTLRFILLVVTHRRIRQWDEIIKAFRDLCDERAGVLRARLTTARPLDGKRKNEMAGSLGKALGRPVLLEAAVNESLIGGSQLQVGSTVYDGSVAGVLKSLREILVKG